MINDIRDQVLVSANTEESESLSYCYCYCQCPWDTRFDWKFSDKIDVLYT